jgi:hypothetical protein
MELVIASAIFSIAVIGLVGSFITLQKALMTSKIKTLAANLAQEQMQVLKQKSYYAVVTTQSPQSLSVNGNTIFYDTSYFPPEPIVEGGRSFTRYTFVEAATEDSGSLVILAPNAVDAGLKRITVSVVWQLGNTTRYYQIRSLMANKDTVMNNVIINGRVRDASTLSPISGALVDAAQDLGYRDTTNSVGSYTINLTPGTYNLTANYRGYFPQFVTVNLSANSVNTNNFDLVQMSSGSIVGTAWVAAYPVISQVVVSTPQANGFTVQYVELFNPTTSDITIGGSPPPIKLNFKSTCPAANLVKCDDPTWGIKLNYVNTVMASGHYYLVANTSTFMVNGQAVTADAYYADDASAYCNPTPTGYSPSTSSWNSAGAPPVKLLALSGHNGVFWLTDTAGSVLDTAGWTHTTALQGCEGSCRRVYAGDGSGLGDNQEMVRYASTSGVSALWGPAYDSDDNSVDFSTFPTLAYSPSSSASAFKDIIAARVPDGAVVSATDGLSVSTKTVRVGTPPHGEFFLTPVATGTWTVYISSGNYSLITNDVPIPSMGSVYRFESTTTFISLPNTYGFVEGRVTDANGNAIGGSGIYMDPGTIQASLSTGRYILSATPGYTTVTANPGNLNSSYVQLSSANVPVVLGAVTGGVDFVLSQGGRITGFVTRDGVNALPNVAVAFYDSNGQPEDQQISDNSGRFTSKILSTGTYSLEPALDSFSSSSPSSATVSVVQGATRFSSTFTISGALAHITGTVTYNSAVVKTGVLLVASTGTLPSGPPALSSASLTSSAYYMTSSKEDGTYDLEVRQANYNIYCYYFTGSGGSTLVSKVLTAGTTAGYTTPNIDCSLP